jgi:hypothetical protein
VNSDKANIDKSHLVNEFPISRPSQAGFLFYPQSEFRESLLLHSNSGAKLLIACRKSQGPSGDAGDNLLVHHLPALRARSLSAQARQKLTFAPDKNPPGSNWFARNLTVTAGQMPK